MGKGYLLLGMALIIYSVAMAEVLDTLAFVPISMLGGWFVGYNIPTKIKEFS